MEEQTPEKKKLLSPEKVTIGAIVSFLFLVFGAIVVFSAQYGDTSNTSSTTATPAPDGLFQAGAQSNLSAKQQQQQVQGAQTQNIPKPPVAEPTIEPTEVPLPSQQPTPSPSLSPSPSPSSSTSSEGPKISGISADNIENNKATIKFALNKDADAKIEYGIDTEYGKTKEESSKKISHTIEISDLEANKTYHYRIISKDSDGNSTTSEDNEFKTKP
jgi:hypothetical protein